MLSVAKCWVPPCLLRVLVVPSVVTFALKSEGEQCYSKSDRIRILHYNLIFQ